MRRGEIGLVTLILRWEMKSAKLDVVGLKL